MASSEPVRGVIRHVRPLISSNREEARKRVLNLYRIWCRNLPRIIFDYGIPIEYDEARLKLRNEFLKHKHITDPRAIDMLVLKGQLEFQEIISNFKQRCQVLYMFKETELPKPNNFLSKFLSGTN